MVNFGEFEVEESSDYGQKIPSIKEITLLHLRKISELCCQEFTGGYWQEKPIKIGGGMVIAKTYISDVKESYCNAVDFLIDIIYAYADENLRTMIDREEKLIHKDKDSKLNSRKKIFREINNMFVRTKYFDSLAGRTETSGR